MSHLKARLVESVELAPNVRHFVFEVPGVEKFHFSPGQFVSFKSRLGEKEVVRAYSLVSSPNGSNRFELCLNRVDDGLLSPHLFDLPLGGEIEIQEPLGYFTLRHPDRDALFIATGTGIAPFRSLLLSHLPESGQRFTLLFGVRHEQGILYGKEFEELQERHSNFRFWPTVTRPSESWRGRTGRVQAHLEEAIGENRNLDVYICGMKDMVDDVRVRLKQMGFDRKQIIYEKYD